MSPPAIRTAGRALALILSLFSCGHGVWGVRRGFIWGSPVDLTQKQDDTAGHPVIKQRLGWAGPLRWKCLCRVFSLLLALDGWLWGQYQMCQHPRISPVRLDWGAKGHHMPVTPGHQLAGCPAHLSRWKTAEQQVPGPTLLLWVPCSRQGHGELEISWSSRRYHLSHSLGLS